MGYYTGSGKVTAGGESISVFQRYIWNGTHVCYQRKASTSTRKSGVSLSTAQNEQSSLSVEDITFYIGSAWYSAPGAKGREKSVSYSQIDGSNLYELNIEETVTSAKLDNGAWQTP
ncbi:MAG: hypothetical protein IKO72_00515 [Kiritimatiellae bacterium]|nr:hypothetical protein [Kiritimatiellia bacterium]